MCHRGDDGSGRRVLHGSRVGPLQTRVWPAELRVLTSKRNRGLVRTRDECNFPVSKKLSWREDHLQTKCRCWTTAHAVAHAVKDAA